MLGLFRGEKNTIYADGLKQDRHHGKILIVDCVWRFEMNQVYAKFGLECLEKSNFNKDIVSEFKKFLQAVLILDSNKIYGVEIPGITGFDNIERLSSWECEKSLRYVKSIKEELNQIYNNLDKIINGDEDLVLCDIKSDKLNLKEFTLSNDGYEIKDKEEMKHLSKDEFHLVANGNRIYFDLEILKGYDMCHIIVPEKITGDYYFDLFLEITEFINAKRSINCKDVYRAFSEEGMVIELAQYVNVLANKIIYFKNCSSVRSGELFIFDLISIENTLDDLKTFVAIGQNMINKCIEALSNNIAKEV